MAADLLRRKGCGTNRYALDRVRHFPGHHKTITAAVYSAATDSIITADDRALRAWCLRDMRQRASLHVDVSLRCLVGIDAHKVVMGAHGHDAVSIHDAGSLALLLRFTVVSGVMDLAVAQADCLLWVLGSKARAQVWGFHNVTDRARGSIDVYEAVHLRDVCLAEEPLGGLIVHPSRSLLIGYAYSSLFVYDVSETGAGAVVMEMETEWTITAAAVVPGCELVLVGGLTGAIHVYSMSGPRLVLWDTLLGHTTRVNCIRPALTSQLVGPGAMDARWPNRDIPPPLLNTVASVADDGTLRVWDLPTGIEMTQQVIGRPASSLLTKAIQSAASAGRGAAARHARKRESADSAGDTKVVKPIDAEDGSFVLPMPPVLVFWACDPRFTVPHFAGPMLVTITGPIVSALTLEEQATTLVTAKGLVVQMAPTRRGVCFVATIDNIVYVLEPPLPGLVANVQPFMAAYGFDHHLLTQMERKRVEDQLAVARSSSLSIKAHTKQQSDGAAQQSGDSPSSIVEKRRAHARMLRKGLALPEAVLRRKQSRRESARLSRQMLSEQAELARVARSRNASSISLGPSDSFASGSGAALASPSGGALSKDTSLVDRILAEVAASRGLPTVSALAALPEPWNGFVLGYDSGRVEVYYELQQAGSGSSDTDSSDTGSSSDDESHIGTGPRVSNVASDSITVLDRGTSFGVDHGGHISALALACGVTHASREPPCDGPAVVLCAGNKAGSVTTWCLGCGATLCVVQMFAEGDGVVGLAHLAGQGMVVGVSSSVVVDTLRTTDWRPSRARFEAAQIFVSLSAETLRSSALDRARARGVLATAVDMAETDGRVGHILVGTQHGALGYLATRSSRPGETLTALRRRHVLERHTHQVEGVALCAQAVHGVSSSMDGVVCVWDLVSGVIIHMITRVEHLTGVMMVPRTKAGGLEDLVVASGFSAGVFWAHDDISCTQLGAAAVAERKGGNDAETMARHAVSAAKVFTVGDTELKEQANAELETDAAKSLAYLRGAMRDRTQSSRSNPPGAFWAHPSASSSSSSSTCSDELLFPFTNIISDVNVLDVSATPGPDGIQLPRLSRLASASERAKPRRGRQPSDRSSDRSSAQLPLDVASSPVFRRKRRLRRRPQSPPKSRDPLVSSLVAQYPAPPPPPAAAAVAATAVPVVVDDSGVDGADAAEDVCTLASVLDVIDDFSFRTTAQATAWTPSSDPATRAKLASLLEAHPRS